MRKLGLLVPLLAFGCASPHYLDRKALRHEDRAARLAKLGEGERALAESYEAEVLRAKATLRAQRRASLPTELLFR